MGITLPGAAPVVNIYVDGVKKTVQQHVDAQTSLGNVSRTNAYMSYHESL